MKHRGRHRRRRRGQAVRAVLAGTALGLTAVATMISASQATVAQDPGVLKPLTSAARTGQLALQERLVPRRSLDRLASAMGRPVGVDAVLRGADRRLRRAADCAAADRASLPVAPAATHAYCWDPADTATPGWRPASVTTSGDADDDGLWGRNRVILAGWTHSARTGPDRGLAQVAFVNAADPARLTYRWVLLAVPTAGGHGYRGLVSHLSGMAWHHDKLLVTAAAGDRAALYAFDLNRIQRTTADTTTTDRAHGYRYVMPAVGSYRFTGGRCARHGVPCLGGLSVDRGSAPDSLVLGEWTRPGGEDRARLWRYAFDRSPERSGLLATDAAGRVTPAEAYATRAGGIRGVLAYRRAGSERSSWYVGRAPGAMDRRGTLWRQDASGARPARCGGEAGHRCWTAGTGSLSYWQETGEVWSVTDRMLFSVPLASVDRSMIP